jgi:mercuric ion transport protein
MKLWLDKFGTAGAVIAAAACPICFPKLAIIGAVVGLSFLAPFERYVYIAIQVLVVAALLGHAWAFRRHRNIYLLGLAGAGTLAVLSAYHYFFLNIEPLVYGGLGALAAASIWLVVENKRCATCESTAITHETSRQP